MRRWMSQGGRDKGEGEREKGEGEKFPKNISRIEEPVKKGGGRFQPPPTLELQFFSPPRLGLKGATRAF